MKHYYRQKITLLFLLVSSCEVGSQSTFNAELTVNLNEYKWQIPDKIFGTNLQWEWNGDRILVESQDGLDWRNDVIEATRQAGITNIRFPGGALADSYWWQDGIGVQSSRKTGITYSGEVAPSNFGSDELIELARVINAEPVMIINFNSTLSDAGNWVQYMNGSPDTDWGALRSRNGHAEPMTTRYWEIGNEIYSPNEPGHTTAVNYGKKLREFAAAMKRVDPDIKIGAALEISFLQADWMPGIYPHMETWNEEVLQTAGDAIDFVSLHFYAPFDKASNRDLRQLVLAAPITFEQNLELVKKHLRQYVAEDVELTITEYNTFFGDTVKLDPRTASTEAALFNALMLFSFMRNPDITLANHHSLLNNDVFGMLETTTTGQLNKRPTFDVFEQLSQFSNRWMLPIQILSDGYPQNAKGNVGEITDVPYIDAVAVSNEKGFDVAIVNRAYSNSVTLRMNIEGDTSSREIQVVSFRSTNVNMSYEWESSILKPDFVSDNQIEITLPPQSFSVLHAR